ncbi:hypothetical protein L1049_013727 [Liquidambar formosana]|uniref:Uncharacterized protein n=1 Tax=Liquidambar formosana TaxID=63359 RepID=A0AAP0WUJ6_LIQFO
MTNSTAFINGIKLVSAPDSLINNVGFDILTAVGDFPRLSTYSYKIMSRLNMGGPLIASPNDTLELSKSINELKFNVYINGKIAISRLELSTIAGLMTPYYKDVVAIKQHKRFHRLHGKDTWFIAGKNSPAGSPIKALQSMNNCSSKLFTLINMQKATNDFNPSARIGVGGFSGIYLGEFDDEMKVAMKRRNPKSTRGNVVTNSLERSPSLAGEVHVGVRRTCRMRPGAN